MPQEIIDSYELQTITLDYRRECQHNDVVDSLSSHEPDKNLEAISQLNGTNGSAASPSTEDYCHFLHLLRLSGDGLEINRGRTQWRKKPMRVPAESEESEEKKSCLQDASFRDY